MKKLFYLFAFVAILGLTACGKDDEPDSKFDDITLTYEKTYTIPNGSGIAWKSSNELIASVSGNTVTAEHVGEAIISSQKGSFKVTVRATVNTYKEPCLDWGASKNTVKSFMNGYSGVKLDTDDASSLIYLGTATQSVLLLSYSFENSKLENSGIALNSDYVSVNSMTDFLLERYIPVTVDESNYRFYFVNPEKNMAVLMQLASVNRTIVYLVVYAPVDLSSKSRTGFDFENIFNFEYDSSVNLKPTFEHFKSIF